MNCVARRTHKRRCLGLAAIRWPRVLALGGRTWIAREHICVCVLKYVRGRVCIAVASKVRNLLALASRTKFRAVGVWG